MHRTPSVARAASPGARWGRGDQLLILDEGMSLNLTVDILDRNESVRKFGFIRTVLTKISAPLAATNPPEAQPRAACGRARLKPVGASVSRLAAATRDRAMGSHF